MDSREVIQRLRDAGFEHVSTKGSHKKFRRGDKMVIVPDPKKDIPAGTLRSIYRQADLPWPP
ncbi:type II toxin-antitoxin system HicA family toxin [Oceanidesulfovibrio marinus]|uniref:Type II toxin-antitoxin system HicA family toxin n=1 Tax=Oceanidesulfovibrio marinus TaxID=370038 RepID=A0ABX6NMA9_9BACT|nr:type II toxin-antitoxin system HicA family toxin [Oceanidesulfovibrio marinus]QJT11183.1 type II toxin-antitoxin system HicA family toxin [Oceanidesulfovibrio marinus]